MAYAVYLNAPLAYAEATRLQERLLEARIADRIDDVVLFLEHPPVVTLGNRGRRQHLLSDEAHLANAGIELFPAARGGDVTFHGPGQLVMYPILRLGTRAADSHGYLHNLEEVAVRTAADFGVAAYRRDGMNGAWTDAGKLAAIGFRLRRWVSYHGMSFNVDCDLEGFRHIVPCGLTGERVTSLKALLGPGAPALPEVREAMARWFAILCDRPLAVVGPDAEAPAPLAALLRI